MIGELQSQVQVIVQQAEQKDKKQQKATGGSDIEPQSKRSETIERKEYEDRKFPRKGTRKLSTHEGHRASRPKGPSVLA